MADGVQTVTSTPVIYMFMFAASGRLSVEQAGGGGWVQGEIRLAAGNVHAACERVEFIERGASDVEGRIDHHQLIGGFEAHLKPGVVFYCSVGLSIPVGERVSLGIKLPALLEERPSPEVHLPA